VDLYLCKVKQKSIVLLGVVFSVVLLGLIVIQVMWLRHTISLERASFDQGVQKALKTTVAFLEDVESKGRLKELSRTRFLFFDQDSLTEIDSTRKKMLPFELKALENGLLQYEEHYYNQNDSLSAIPGKSEADFPIKLHVELDPLLDKETSYSELSKDMSQSSGKKTYVGDIVNRLMEVRLNQNIAERINKPLLDSLLTHYLSEQSVDLLYTYLVVDEKKGMALSSNNNVIKYYETSNYEYYIKLFPNDVFDTEQHLYVQFEHKNRALYKRILWLLIIAFVIVLSLISLFSIVLYAVLRQKQLSEIKNDFINNMTHELKTPISTISLAYEALKDPSVKDQILKEQYVNMIGEENSRLHTIVENVLQHAVMDKGGLKLSFISSDIHKIIEHSSRKMKLMLEEKQGILTLKLGARSSILLLDKLHWTNVLSNLIDNAIKYTDQRPLITITTENKKGSFILSIQDNGLGIKKENQQKIFDKLFRVSTGNRHDVKGFGLGLSYVKRIVEEHKGSIRVKSKLGTGSTFIITLPLTA